MFERTVLKAIFLSLTLAATACGGGGGKGVPDAAKQLPTDEEGEETGLTTSCGEPADSGTASVPHVLAVVGEEAWDLVIDDANLYWIEPNPNQCRGPSCSIRVQAMSKAGGDQMTLATFAAFGWSLATDQDSVYLAIWTRDDDCYLSPCTPPYSLYRLSKSGGSPTLLGYCAPTPFSSDGDAIYCLGEVGPTDAGILDLVRVPTSGIGAAVLDPSHGQAKAVTDWGADVFWVGDDYVERIPKIGGTPVRLFERPGMRYPERIPVKVDQSFVYFAAFERVLDHSGRNVDRPALYAVPRLGGQPIVLREGAVTSLDAQGELVYWTDSTCLGRIRSDGCDARCLDTGKPMSSVRVDDTDIFYVRDGREIIRMPKAAPPP